MAGNFIHLVFFTTFNFFYISNAEASWWGKWGGCCDPNEVAEPQKEPNKTVTVKNSPQDEDIGTNPETEVQEKAILPKNDDSKKAKQNYLCHMPGIGRKNQITKNISVENIENSTPSGYEIYSSLSGEINQEVGIVSVKNIGSNTRLGNQNNDPFTLSRESNQEVGIITAKHTGNNVSPDHEPSYDSTLSGENNIPSGYAAGSHCALSSGYSFYQHNGRPFYLLSQQYNGITQKIPKNDMQIHSNSSDSSNSSNRTIDEEFPHSVAVPRPWNNLYQTIHKNSDDDE